MLLAMPRLPSVAVWVPPPGLVYVPDFVTPAEESALLAQMESLPWEAVVMRGGIAKRTVVHYGRSYGYDARAVGTHAPPLPEFLRPFLPRAAALAEKPPEAFVEALLSRYPPGAQIGWHRDAPAFGRVVGLSLGGAARLRMRRDHKDHRETFEITLEPRSGYLLSGAARWQWQHHIPATGTTRHSVTLRTLRERTRRHPAGVLAV